MNNHEDQTKQTYESYTFQALMSFSVAYYATCVTYFSCPKKGCMTLEQNRALNFQDSVYHDSCVFWSLASKHRIFFCLHLV